METYNFIPYTSVGPIKFGEPRNDVRIALGDYKEYKKNKFSENTLDDFGSCQVFYNKQNQVEAIELYRNSELIFKGVNLFSLNESQLVAIVNDPDAQKDEYSITFPSIGMSITLIDKEPDSILLYERGYM